MNFKDLFDLGPGNARCRQEKCQQLVSRKNGNTSGMQHHLRKYHPHLLDDEADNETTKNVLPSSIPSFVNYAVNPISYKSVMNDSARLENEAKYPHQNGSAMKTEFKYILVNPADNSLLPNNSYSYFDDTGPSSSKRPKRDTFSAASAPVYDLQLSPSSKIIEDEAATSSNNAKRTRIRRKPVEFTRERRAEISTLIEQGKCSFEECGKNGTERVIHGDAAIAVRCITCLALFSMNTLTHVKQHVLECEENVRNRIPYEMSTAEKNEFALRLLNFVGVDSSALALTQSKSFKDFLQYAIDIAFKVGRSFPNFSAPNDIIPNSSTIKSLLKNKVNQSFAGITELIKKKEISRAVVILDYSSMAHYLIITVQYMYLWEIKSFVLAIRDTNDSTAPANIKKTLTKILENFGLKFDLQFVVADDVDAFDQSSSSVFLSPILNNILMRTTKPQDSLPQTVADFGTLLNKLESLISSVKRSTKIPSDFSSKIVVDYGTHMLSNIQIIHGWMKLTLTDKKRLKEFYKDDIANKGILEDIIQKESNFSSYLTVMEIFMHKLLIFERASPSSNEALLIYYELETHLKTFTASNHGLMKSISASAMALLESYQHFFKKPIFYAACILDIYKRSKIFKLRGISEAEKAKQETEKMFIDFVKSTFDAPDTPSNEVIPAIEYEKDDDDDDFAMMPSDRQPIKMEQPIIASAKSELNYYYSYRPTAEEKELKNVLLFWKSAAEKFPLLSKFAAFVLAIPANSHRIPGLNRGDSEDCDFLDPSTISDLIMFQSFKKL